MRDLEPNRPGRWMLLLAAILLPACPSGGEEEPAPPPALRVDPTLVELSSGETARVEEALSTIRDSGKRGYATALIELLRAQEVGIVAGVERGSVIEALETISGEEIGDDWPEWVRWTAKNDLSVPVGFAGWKGQLLTRIDARFGRILPYGVPARIRVEEIVWGGVAFEGIPALDDPKTLAAPEASGLTDPEPVFGVAIGGGARAYPLRILDWHEMANDTVGGVPIALAYCTLCGSGIVYDRRGPDGTVYDFGSSGLLLRSNKLMVDRQTASLWNQFTGEPVVGPLADREHFRLTVLPSVVTTWGAWRRRHPETRVLSFETGFDRPYHPGAAYADYFASDGTMFPVREHSRALPPKARVVGIELEGLAKAYPVERLVAAGVVNDSVGATPVVLVAAGEQIEVSGRSVRSALTRRYRAGAAVRVYERGESTFRRGPASDLLLDGEGREWHWTEEALVGPDARLLPRVPSVQAYWFGWNAFHPRTAIYSD